MGLGLLSTCGFIRRFLPNGRASRDAGCRRTVAITLVVVFAAVAVPGAAGADILDSFKTVAEGSFLPGASALHGDQLAWASPRIDSVDFMLTNLSTRQTEVLTSVVHPPEGMQVSGFAFDGRWLAWLDDRFGNVEAFTLDISDGSLHRLTRTADDESGLTVAAGRAAWVLNGRLWLVDLQTDVRTLVTPTGFQDRESCLSESFLVISRFDGEETLALVALDIGRNHTWTVAREATVGQSNAHCAGSLAAWESVQYVNATGKPKSIRMVRWIDLDGGESQNVTNINQRHGRIVGFAAEHLAWLDVKDGGLNLIVHDVASNQTLDLGPIEFAGMSADVLVVARENPAQSWTLSAESWTLYAKRWDDDGSDGPSRWIPFAPLGQLAVVLLAVAGLRVRVRL